MHCVIKNAVRMHMTTDLEFGVNTMLKTLTRSYLFIVISRASYYIIYCNLVTFLEHSMASVTTCMTFFVSSVRCDVYSVNHSDYSR